MSLSSNFFFFFALSSCALLKETARCRVVTVQIEDYRIIFVLLPKCWVVVFSFNPRRVFTVLISFTVLITGKQNH